jgi:hypothetical protein
MERRDIKYIYEIESSIYFDTIIDVLKEELNLKEGKLSYFSLDIDDWVEEVLPIEELKDRAMDIFFEQDDMSLIFDNVELNLTEDKIEIISKIKLTLKGIDVDKITCDGVLLVKLNLDNLKSEDILDR